MDPVRKKSTTLTPDVTWVFVAVTVAAFTGTRLAGIAIPWFVLTATGSPVQTGIVAFAEMAPYVLVKALSGPVIDRVGPVVVSVAAGVLSMAAVAAVPLLHATGALRPAALLLLVALIGALRAPGDGAKTTLIPVVARAAGVPLERVGGLYGAVDRSAATLGAVFGAVVITAVGAASALWATTLLIGIDIALTGLVLAPLLAGVDLRSPRFGFPAGRGSYTSELREGWRFLRGDPVLVAVVGMLAFTNMLEQAFGVALVPVWALTTGGGPGAVGALFATAAAASVVGAVTAASLAERLPRRPTYVLAYLLVGVPRFAVLAWGLPLPVALVVLAVAGFAGGFINPVIGAIVMERIPGHLMGRVNTLAMACAWALLPFGGVLGGVLVRTIGLHAALWLVAAAYVIATMTPTALTAWSGIDEPTVTSREASAVAAGAGQASVSTRRTRRQRQRTRVLHMRG